LVRDATTLLFRRAADRTRPDWHPRCARRSSRAAFGRAILLSSHLLHLVEEICTRVIIMDHGRIVPNGTFEELASRAIWLGRIELEQIFMRVTGRDPAT